MRNEYRNLPLYMDLSIFHFTFTIFFLHILKHLSGDYTFRLVMVTWWIVLFAIKTYAYLSLEILMNTMLESQE